LICDKHAAADPGLEVHRDDLVDVGHLPAGPAQLERRLDPWGRHAILTSGAFSSLPDPSVRSTSTRPRRSYRRRAPTLLSKTHSS
jgi:hypothetical protein